MKIIVIGGSGFIGTRLVDVLLQQKHSVYIFDKNPSATFNNLVVRGDVRNYEPLERAAKGFDVIYNLAAEHRDDVRPISLYYDVNVKGAKNIVEAAVANKVKKIVFTSTVAVYGLNKPNPDEENPTEPFNDYGKSKLQAEGVFNQWAAGGADRTLVVVRPVVIFGEGNRGNVYNLINQIAQRKFIMVGDGSNRKSMGYVGNIAKFLVQAMEFGAGRHIFNYADKPDMTVEELVDHVRSELHIARSFRSLPYSLGLMGGYVFDVLAGLSGKRFPISSIRIKKFCANTTVSTRALESIGFTPSVSLKEGLARMIGSMGQGA